jgi:hypothetical protein
MALREPEIPYVDYTSIHFPTDRITIGDLRRMYPDLFAAQEPPIPPKDDKWREACVKALRERGLTIPPEENRSDAFLQMLRAMPGDQSTIGDLRRLHPDLFDVEGAPESFHPMYEALPPSLMPCGTNELLPGWRIRKLWGNRTTCFDSSMQKIVPDT